MNFSLLRSRWKLGLACAIFVIGIFVYQTRHAPLELGQMSDQEILAIVAREVPLGSSPLQVKTWLERRSLRVHAWKGASLRNASHMEVVFPPPAYKFVFFEFDTESGLKEASIYEAPA